MILEPIQQGTGSSAGNYRWNVDLIGVKDGVNKVFTSPDKFSRSPLKEVVATNGVLQDEGATEDYVASESGGPGTGYDTITFVVAPYSWEKATISYVLF